MGVKVLFIVKEIEGAEPLGALYVAGCLQQAGHDCRFIGTRGIDDSYYTESVLSFSSESEKRQIENLHKVFAVVAAIPALLPLAKRLLKLPPNDFFYAMFRSWYLICHMTDVMPRRLKWKDLAESLLGIFGVYRGKDDNWHPSPPLQALPDANVADSAIAETSPNAPVLTLRRKAQTQLREELANGAHGARAPHVDKKGMPVRDNLLE
jgi:hypothetical protein